jgi:hypothetical protein
MTTVNMFIHRKDITLIGEIMDELPHARSFRLEKEEGGGIGTTLKLIAATDFNGKPVEVTFEISGVEDW